MWIVGWIVAGAAVGLIANLMAHKRGVALFPDVVLGVLGACVAGWILSALAGFGFQGVGVAVLGAVLLLFVSHAPDAGSEMS
jgi:uncharacterized membrane protein YeaQ/YmgE (transglycosylase-associated protein family)